MSASLVSLSFKTDPSRFLVVSPRSRLGFGCVIFAIVELSLISQELRPKLEVEKAAIAKHENIKLKIELSVSTSPTGGDTLIV